eukprot:2658045-Alexandrium_andersonii.AAC.1
MQAWAGAPWPPSVRSCAPRSAACCGSPCTACGHAPDTCALISGARAELHISANATRARAQ